MKANYYIAFLLCVPGYFFHTNAAAQNIRGDTIFVDINRLVEVIFPSSPDKAVLVSEGQEGVYEVSNFGKKSLSIKALKKDAKDQALEVTEGGRKHLFILSYKDGSPAQRLDYSSKKKLSARAEKVAQEISNRITATNSLYEHAVKSISDQALWEEVGAEYLKFLNVAGPKDTGIVKSRWVESGIQIERIKEKGYSDAIKEGQDYFFDKQYSEARKAYQRALAERPGDPQALKYINLTDSVWAKDYIDKGDKARNEKKYVLAKAYYQEAMRIKPDFPLLQIMFEQVKKDADPLIYKNEREKGDQAMKANDIAEARRSYDSALSVKPGDGYITNKLKKVIIEEEKIEKEEKDEAAYQDILAIAKILADKAGNADEYSLAIKEYERARAKFPARKFPRKKIGELTKIKYSIRIN